MSYFLRFRFGQFLLGDFLTLAGIANDLTYAISIGLLAECFALGRSHFSMAFIHHGINAHYVKGSPFAFQGYKDTKSFSYQTTFAQIC